MASLVICAALAFSTIVRSVALLFGSPPPSRAATSSWRAILAKTLARALSAAPFLCLIVAHLEWPDMAWISSGERRLRTGDVSRNSACSRSSSVSSGGTRRRARCPGGRAPARRRASPSTSTPSPDRLDLRRADEHGVERVVEAGDVDVVSRSCRPGGRSRCAARRCRSRRSCAGRVGRRARRSASRIIPAHVPNTGMPVARARSASGSNSSAVLEQPRHRRALAARHDQRVDGGEIGGCADLRGVARRARASARSCAANAPCSARTPTDRRSGASPGGSDRPSRRDYQPRSA